MIEVLIGPANSGKTEILTSRVSDVIAAGRRGALLVVPSTSTAVSRDLLRGEVQRVPLESINTFPALYHTILDKAGVWRQSLSLIERDRVLRFVIGELARAGRLQYFGETAEMPGLVNALGRFIDELWRSGTSPAEFNRIVETRGLKDRDIAQVFAGYAAALESLRAVDVESAGPAALSALASSTQAQRWFSLIAIDGFDLLTAVQVRLLSTLAARGVEVIVSLTYDEARAIHYWQRPTLARLQSAGAAFTRFEVEPKGAIQIAAAALMNEHRAATAIKTHPAERGLQSAEIISAPDRAAEVRAAVREVKRLIVADHIPPDEVAIVCRSLSAYAHHLERIFAECEIPLELDTPLMVTENPAVVALLRLFALAGQSFSRRACLDVWRSPYFDWSEFGLDENTINLLDAVSLAAHVTRGREQWSRAAADFAEKKMHEKIGVEHTLSADENEAGRRARYEQLAANLERWLDAVTPFTRASREAHFTWASDLIVRLRVDERAASGEKAQRDASALKEFKSIFAALAHQDLTRRLAPQSDEPATEDISWQMFVSELERMLSVVTYDRDAIASPAVVAQEAHRLRPRRYRVVFVLGLIEGEFPARLTERAPYTMTEREALRQTGLDLTETTNDAGADLLPFYKVMSRAVERLCLSYARTDVAGGELLPSYLIEEVQPFATSPLRRIPSAFGGDDAEAAPACSLEELAMRTARARRRAKATGGIIDDSETRAAAKLLNASLSSWPMTERGAQLEWQRMSRVERDSSSGWILDPALRAALKQRFGPEYLWSASQINDYGICPFRFFARHALKLDAHEEPGEGFASHHLGHAYHRILERLYTELHRSDVTIQSDTAERATDEAARIADLVLKEMLDTGEVRRDGVWEFSKAEIKRRIGRLLRREAAWNDAEPARPTDCECKFGMDGAEALIIDCPGGEIRFCGIVDRIDRRREDGDWVVVDYKTRRTPISIKDALDGRNLQLPLYAMAATRVIKKGERVASAYYLHIHSRKRGSQLSKKDDSPASLDSLIQHAEARIREYVEQVRGGGFPVRPNGDSVCQTCDYGVMCRVQSLRATEDEQDRND